MEDINECEHPDQYHCYGVCTNKPGRYDCQCRPGTSGDASRQNGCRDKDNFKLVLKVVIATLLSYLNTDEYNDYQELALAYSRASGSTCSSRRGS
ncbi:hypothetical protein EJB05_19284, partial [Eragrostis curvula]